MSTCFSSAFGAESSFPVDVPSVDAVGSDPTCTVGSSPCGFSESELDDSEFPFSVEASVFCEFVSSLLPSITEGDDSELPESFVASTGGVVEVSDVNSDLSSSPAGCVAGDPPSETVDGSVESPDCSLASFSSFPSSPDVVSEASPVTSVADSAPECDVSTDCLPDSSVFVKVSGAGVSPVSEGELSVTGAGVTTSSVSFPSAPFAAASVEAGVSGFDGAGVFSDVASGNTGWTSGTPFSLTTASGNSGWTSGSPLSVTTASGNSGWTAGSPLSVTTASGNSG
ncbi:Uncharacterised protein [Streptococcus pneumoniae]|nr:Uncharacterised protein [Streptococcus pneumoniae]